jgi:soluble lytic murein transglycosylase
MRQESRFDPNARSNVGAIGLFQIMTYTAEALAHRAGVPNVLDNGSVNESTLAHPAVNSAIAARLTADLLGIFDGANAPVAASYHAGEDRVAIWWAAASGVPEDFFVDTIPYSETRRFVREVLANRSAYERVYGGQ